MTFLLWLLAFVEILTSFFLISAILIQKTKSQGSGLAFGASMGESLFGSQAGNFLTRTTVILAIVFLANTVLLGMIGVRRSSHSVVDKVAPEKEAAAAVPQPRPASPAHAEAPLAAPNFGETAAPVPAAAFPGAAAPAPAPADASVPDAPSAAAPAPAP